MGKYNLGNLYQLGLGVPKNLDTARDLFQEACQEGSDQSCVALTQLLKKRLSK